MNSTHFIDDILNTSWSSIDLDIEVESDEAKANETKAKSVRCNYTLERKAQVLELLDQNANNASAVGRLTGIDRRVIRRWANQRFEIEAMAHHRRDRSRLLGGGRKTKFEAIEIEVKKNL